MYFLKIPYGSLNNILFVVERAVIAPKPLKPDNFDVNTLLCFIN